VCLWDDKTLIEFRKYSPNVNILIFPDFVHGDRNINIQIEVIAVPRIFSQEECEPEKLSCTSNDLEFLHAFFLKFSRIIVLVYFLLNAKDIVGRSVNVLVDGLNHAQTLNIRNYSWHDFPKL